MDAIAKKETEAADKFERTRQGLTFAPDVDIVNGKNEIRVIADMPGVDEKSVNITLEKSVLNITGHVSAKDFDGYRDSYSEYETGDFSRSFTISDDIDKDGIKAVVKNGVLRVTLPKREQVSRTIEVKAA